MPNSPLPNLFPVGVISKSLPSKEELREILSYLDSSDRDQWFKVFAILGRAYRRNPEILEVAREWSRNYGGRNEAADAKKEDNEFYTASLRDGPSIGALIADAKNHGYTKTHYERLVREENSPCAAYFADHVDVCIQDPVTPVMGDEERLLRTAEICANDSLGYWLFYATPSDDQLRLQFLNEHRKYFRFMPPRYRKGYATLLDYCSKHKTFDVSDFKAWCKENALDLTPEDVDSFANVNTIPATPDRTWEQMHTMYEAAWRLLFCQQMRNSISTVLSSQYSFDDAQRVRRALFERSKEVPKSSIMDGDDFAYGARMEIDDLMSIDGPFSSYISTGYEAIDQLILGYRRGGVTLFAARSGVGKTWFGVDTSYRVAVESKKRVLFISSEMDPNSVAARFLAVMNNISLSRKSLEANTKDGTLVSAYQNMAILKKENGISLRIMGNTEGGISIDDIEAEISNSALMEPVDLVVVDYLQNITNDNLGRNATSFDRNKDTMLRLDSMARRYNCAILALAQLNNPNRKQGNMAPNLYEIAECTYVVQPATAVLMLYKVPNSADQSKLDLKLSVTKSRYGSCTDVPMQVTRSNGGSFGFSV